jgi:hypothetical protein
MAVIAAAAAAQKRRNDDAAAIGRSLEPWARLARERGLAFASTSGVPVIEGELLGVTCRAAIELDPHRFGHTRVTAQPLANLDPSARVGVVPNPRGLVGFLKHHLTQDVPVGDAEFDDAFLVRAKPESLASALLGPDLRSYLTALAAHRLGAFVWEARAIQVLFANVVVETDVVSLALDAAVEAARWTPPAEAPFR